VLQLEKPADVALKKDGKGGYTAVVAGEPGSNSDRAMR